MSNKDPLLEKAGSFYDGGSQDTSHTISPSSESGVNTQSNDKNNETTQTAEYFFNKMIDEGEQFNISFSQSSINQFSSVNQEIQNNNECLARQNKQFDIEQDISSQDLLFKRYLQNFKEEITIETLDDIKKLINDGDQVQQNDSSDDNQNNQSSLSNSNQKNDKEELIDKIRNGMKFEKERNAKILRKSIALNTEMKKQLEVIQIQILDKDSIHLVLLIKLLKENTFDQKNDQLSQHNNSADYYLIDDEVYKRQSNFKYIKKYFEENYGMLMNYMIDGNQLTYFKIKFDEQLDNNANATVYKYSLNLDFESIKQIEDSREVLFMYESTQVKHSNTKEDNETQQNDSQQDNEYQWQRDDSKDEIEEKQIHQSEENFPLGELLGFMPLSKCEYYHNNDQSNMFASIYIKNKQNQPSNILVQINSFNENQKIDHGLIQYDVEEFENSSEAKNVENNQADQNTYEPKSPIPLSQTQRQKGLDMEKQFKKKLLSNNQTLSITIILVSLDELQKQDFRGHHIDQRESQINSQMQYDKNNLFADQQQQTEHTFYVALLNTQDDRAIQCLQVNQLNQQAEINLTQSMANQIVMWYNLSMMSQQVSCQTVKRAIIDNQNTLIQTSEPKCRGYFILFKMAIQDHMVGQKQDQMTGFYDFNDIIKEMNMRRNAIKIQNNEEFDKNNGLEQQTGTDEQSKEKNIQVDFENWRCAILVNYPQREMNFAMYNNTNTKKVFSVTIKLNHLIDEGYLDNEYELSNQNRIQQLAFTKSSCFMWSWDYQDKIRGLNKVYGLETNNHQLEEEQFNYYQEKEELGKKLTGYFDLVLIDDDSNKQQRYGYYKTTKDKLDKLIQQKKQSGCNYRQALFWKNENETKNFERVLGIRYLPCENKLCRFEEELNCMLKKCDESHQHQNLKPTTEYLNKYKDYSSFQSENKNNNQEKSKQQKPFVINPQLFMLFKKCQGDQDLQYQQDKFENYNKMIIPNVTITEDIRKEIPLLLVQKDYESIKLAMVDNYDILAECSVPFDSQEFKRNSISDDVYQNSKQKSYLLNRIQLTFSSQINMTAYKHKLQKDYSQEFQVLVMYEKQQRFRITTFQVKWIRNSRNDQKFDIKIALIGVKDIVLKQSTRNYSIEKYMLVPLLMQEKKDYINTPKKKVLGTQLLLNLKNNDSKQQSNWNINLRNFHEDYKSGIFNYKQQYTVSQAKQIITDEVEGILAETYFKDFCYKYKTQSVFQNDIAAEYLTQANRLVLNSMIVDFLAIMRMPSIEIENQIAKDNLDYATNLKKLQNKLNQKNKSMKSKNIIVNLEAKLLIDKNYKRFFQVWEILGGSQLIKYTGLNFEQKQQNLQESIFNKQVKDNQNGQVLHRSINDVVGILHDLNKQSRIQDFDVDFIMNRTLEYSCTLLERVLLADQDRGRIDEFIESELLIISNDCMTPDLTMTNLVQNILQTQQDKEPDYKLVQKILEHIFGTLNTIENTKYFSRNRFEYLFQILPYAQDIIHFNKIPKIYYQFFRDDNPNIEFNNQKPNHHFIEISNQLCIMQKFPDKMADHIPLYMSENLCQIDVEVQQNKMSYNKNSQMNHALSNLIQLNSNKQGITKYMVMPYFIDWKPYIFSLQIMKMRKAKTFNELIQAGQIKMDKVKQAKLINDVLNQSDVEISQMKSFRDMIDNDYQNHKISQLINMGTHIAFIGLLIRQMYSNNDFEILIENILCLVIRIFNFVVELLLMHSLGTKVYLNDATVYFYNFNNISYLFYFGWRLQYPKILIPDFEDDDPIRDQRMYFPFFNIVLVASSFIVLMIMARLFEKSGQLIRLVFHTFMQIRYFVLFFVIWVMCFSLMFQISGAKISNSEEYLRLPNLVYYIQTYRNSIGDLSVFTYDYWDETSYRNYEWSIFMIYVIWLLWVTQQFFMFVLLMNFLIAIINQIYDLSLVKAQAQRYLDKSEIFLRQASCKQIFCKKLKKFDLTCILSAHDSESKQQDEQSISIIQHIKSNTQGQLNINQERIERYIESMFDQQFNRFDPIIQKIDKVQHAVNQLHDKIKNEKLKQKPDHDNEGFQNQDQNQRRRAQTYHQNKQTHKKNVSISFQNS